MIKSRISSLPMGKVKQFFRSLSRRLSISMFKARGESIGSRESSPFSSLAQHDTDSKSTSTIETRATSHNEARTSPSTPPIAPIDRTCPETVKRGGASIGSAARKDTVNQRISDLNAYAGLQVNIAILRFVHRLPLDELRIIGQRLTLSSSFAAGNTFEEDDRRLPRSVARPKTMSLASTTRDLSRSFVCGPENRIERNRTGDGCRHDQCAIHERPSLYSSMMDMESHADAITLSLSSQESASAWSFACSSAQLVEREHATRQRGAADMERAPSFTTRSADSCDLFLESIGLSVHPDSIPRTDHQDTDDFDMENLPNWSDVEDDPEYNQFEEQSFHWTDTESSHSSRKSMRMADASSPAFYMPAVDVETVAPNMYGDVAHSNHG